MCGHTSRVVDGSVTERADTINASLVTVQRANNRTNAVVIKWQDPQKPNGLIVNYEIEYKKANIQNVSYSLYILLLCCFCEKRYTEPILKINLSSCVGLRV